MTAASTISTRREPELVGQIVVLTGRDPDRLERAARELGALSSAAFDATDSARLEQFLHDLPDPIDHTWRSSSRRSGST
jgi:NADP-dependent 3-hydroxy acid dehydrogenase YdfG